MPLSLPGGSGGGNGGGSGVGSANLGRVRQRGFANMHRGADISVDDATREWGILGEDRDVHTDASLRLTGGTGTLDVYLPGGAAGGVGDAAAAHAWNATTHTGNPAVDEVQHRDARATLAGADSGEELRIDLPTGANGIGNAAVANDYNVRVEAGAEPTDAVDEQRATATAEGDTSGESLVVSLPPGDDGVGAAADANLWNLEFTRGVEASVAANATVDITISSGTDQGKGVRVTISGTGYTDAAGNGFTIATRQGTQTSITAITTGSLAATSTLVHLRVDDSATLSDLKTYLDNWSGVTGSQNVRFAAAYIGGADGTESATSIFPDGTTRNHIFAGGSDHATATAISTSVTQGSPETQPYVDVTIGGASPATQASATIIIQAGPNSGRGIRFTLLDSVSNGQGAAGNSWTVDASVGTASGARGVSVTLNGTTLEIVVDQNSGTRLMSDIVALLPANTFSTEYIGGASGNESISPDDADFIQNEAFEGGVDAATATRASVDVTITGGADSGKGVRITLAGTAANRQGAAGNSWTVDISSANVGFASGVQASVLGTELQIVVSGSSGTRLLSDLTDSLASGFFSWEYIGGADGTESIASNFSPQDLNFSGGADTNADAGKGLRVTLDSSVAEGTAGNGADLTVQRVTVEYGAGGVGVVLDPETPNVDRILNLRVSSVSGTRLLSDMKAAVDASGHASAEYIGSADGTESLPESTDTTFYATTDFANGADAASGKIAVNCSLQHTLVNIGSSIETAFTAALPNSTGITVTAGTGTIAASVLGAATGDVTTIAFAGAVDAQPATPGDPIAVSLDRTARELIIHATSVHTLADIRTQILALWATEFPDFVGSGRKAWGDVVFHDGIHEGKGIRVTLTGNDANVQETTGNRWDFIYLSGNTGTTSGVTADIQNPDSDAPILRVRVKTTDGSRLLSDLYAVLDAIPQFDLEYIGGADGREFIGTEDFYSPISNQGNFVGGRDNVFAVLAGSGTLGSGFFTSQGQVTVSSFTGAVDYVYPYPEEGISATFNTTTRTMELRARPDDRIDEIKEIIEWAMGLVWPDYAGELWASLELDDDSGRGVQIRLEQSSGLDAVDLRRESANYGATGLNVTRASNDSVLIQFSGSSGTRTLADLYVAVNNLAGARVRYISDDTDGTEFVGDILPTNVSGLKPIIRGPYRVEVNGANSATLISTTLNPIAGGTRTLANFSGGVDEEDITLVTDTNAKTATLRFHWADAFYDIQRALGDVVVLAWDTHLGSRLERHDQVRRPFGTGPAVTITQRTFSSRVDFTSRKALVRIPGSFKPPPNTAWLRFNFGKEDFSTTNLRQAYPGNWQSMHIDTYNMLEAVSNGGRAAQNNCRHFVNFLDNSLTSLTVSNLRRDMYVGRDADTGSPLIGSSQIDEDVDPVMVMYEIYT